MSDKRTVLDVVEDQNLLRWINSTDQVSILDKYEEGSLERQIIDLIYQQPDEVLTNSTSRVNVAAIARELDTSMYYIDQALRVIKEDYPTYPNHLQQQ